MPPRLIEIGKVGDIWQLNLRCDNEDHITKYSALNYYLGAPQSIAFQMEMDTVDIRKSAIPWNRLPRTIQDAVITKHSLAIRYLWVNSFCIIQDDPKDKAIKILQMPRIYGQATVSIIAARSEAVSRGCWVPPK